MLVILLCFSFSENFSLEKLKGLWRHMLLFELYEIYVAMFVITTYFYDLGLILFNGFYDLVTLQQTSRHQQLLFSSFSFMDLSHHFSFARKSCVN